MDVSVEHVTSIYLAYSLTLRKNIKYSSQMSVDFQQDPQRCTPKDTTIHQLCENFKSCYTVKFSSNSDHYIFFQIKFYYYHFISGQFPPISSPKDFVRKFLDIFIFFVHSAHPVHLILLDIRILYL
jgi:hypothetical protein